MALQLSLAMVLVIVQMRSETKVLQLPGSEHGILRVTELCCRNPGQLSSHPRCLHNINVFCSERKSQQELVSMNCSVSVGCCVSSWMSLLLMRQH